MNWMSPPTSRSTLTELDRRGSSCPVLFAWDGSKYQFISDVIGAGVIGHWVSPTATNNADPDEWIKVDGAQLKERDGFFSLRFGEPMEEINFIDQLRLVAIDHPEGTEVYPDERFLDERPFASGKTVVASPATRLPVAAWDDQGHDVLPLLAKRDHNYVRGFTNLSYAGYREHAHAHARCRRMDAAKSSAPLHERLYRIFQRQLDVCRVASGHEAHLAVCGGADAGWKLEARRRGYGLSGRTSEHDRGRSHWKASGRRTPHSYHHQPANLLGPGAG